MEITCSEDKDELVVTQRLPEGSSGSATKPERLRINLVDVQTSLSSPTDSPLPSPLKLYADWSQALAIGAAPSSETSGDEKSRNAKGMPPMTTEKCDYNSLPPALRRKYFSTLERLRLAQKKSSHFSKHGPLPGTYSVSISAKKAHLRKDRRLPYSVPSSSRKLQKGESQAPRYLASQTDAEWFSSLPKKIQRKQFTREEQDLLMNNSDKIILDATDEKLYRLGQQRNRSAGSIHSNRASKSMRTARLNIDSMEGPVASPDIDMKGLMTDSFRWLEEDDDIDLTLDDYHTPVARTTAPSLDQPATPKRRPSFRRTFSLSSITFGRNSNFSHKLAQSDFSRRTSISFAPTTTESICPAPNRSTKASQSESQPRSSAIDPSAKHYQDPDARRKLRVYLASPQKFDEAVEFGFPSLRTQHKDQAKVNPIHVETAVESKDTTSRSFFDDDDDDDINIVRDGEALRTDGDDASIADSDSPKTPQDGHHGRPGFNTIPLMNASKKSADCYSGISRPRVLGTHNEPYPQISSADRVMTLHMTLTRSDLRTMSAKSDTPNKVPLRLSDLPVADAAVTTWDTLPANGGKVKKMWKRLTKT